MFRNPSRPNIRLDAATIRQSVKVVSVGAEIENRSCRTILGRELAFTSKKVVFTY
jgi:hypothetical protein